MNPILSILVKPETLSNQSTAIAAQKWISKQETVGLTQFYPTLSALTVICHMEPQSSNRKALASVIREDIASDFENPVIPELLNWYLNDYHGDSLAVEINTIIEESGESFSHGDALTESLLVVYEAAKDKDNQETINTWFSSVLAYVSPEYVTAFETYLNFLSKFNYQNSGSELFNYCIGPDCGSILKEAVSLDTITFDQFSNLKDLGDTLNLHSLSFYADDEKSAMEMFQSDYCEFDKEKCISTLSKIIADDPSCFTNLMTLAEANFDESELNDVFEDELINDDIKETVATFKSNLLAIDEAAEALYTLLLNENAFDQESEFRSAYREGEEQGAMHEMQEALTKFSCFELGEKYENEDGESLKISFDLKALLADLNRDNDLFSYNPLENYYTLQDYMSDMIFSEHLTKHTKDFEVPYYGFSDFDDELFRERTEELLKQIISEKA